MPRKKTEAKTPNKTRFVLGLPTSMSAKEVIEKGKAAGLKLTDKYIYSIRSKSKVSGKARRKPGRPPNATTPSVGSKAASQSAGGSLEKRLMSVALDLGLARAEQLLATLRTDVARLIG